MSDLDALLRLLPNVSTLHQVQDFLRERDLPFSARSWESIEEERLRPSLKSRRLTEDHLRAFVAEMEEYGSQHVFLYRQTSTSYPDDKALKEWLKVTSD